MENISKSTEQVEEFEKDYIVFTVFSDFLKNIVISKLEKNLFFLESMLNEIYKEFKLSFIFIKRKFLIKRKF
jgi:asparagine synthetase A